MAKLTPEERWRREETERLSALRLDPELKRLTSEGCRLLGRRTQFTLEEWLKDDARARVSTPGYAEWHRRCEMLGQSHGVEAYIVAGICLIQGFEPLGWFSVAPPARICVVTEVEDDDFIANLAYHARELGMDTVRRQGSLDTAILVLDKPPPLQSLPPMLTAFTVRIETPMEFPSDAARSLAQEASLRERELRKRLG